MILLLLACRPPEAAAVGGADTVERYASPPTELVWNEHVVVMTVGFEVPIRQTWSGPREEGGRRLYDVIETEAASDRERTRFTVFYGPEGFGYAATGDGAAWDPPEVVLPAEGRIGDTWRATHVKDGLAIERSCELMAPEHCKDGLVSVCDARTGTRAVITRDHFCAGQGWVAYEALVLDLGKEERRWTEDMKRDGERIGP